MQAETSIAETIINISAYKFVELAVDRLPMLREHLRQKTQSLGLKGTILLATEGINLFVAGTRMQQEAFRLLIEGYPEFSDLPYKESPSAAQPFTRMLVRIKKEIIPMGLETIKPQQHTAARLSAKQLQQWYQDGKDMVILDTRNDYEVGLGTFKDAVRLDLKKFRDFPAAVQRLPESYKNKPVVTFCTGGIRCEKAAEYLSQQGYQDVYQLDGGILRYFEEAGGDFYEGECFVFDKRVAVDTQLRETATTQCYACRQPLTPAQLQAYRGECPHCHDRSRITNTSAVPPRVCEVYNT